jgi:hypothetical protein
MVKGVIPTMKKEEPIGKGILSCTFCGSGTWSTWEVVTEDCVVFVCDRHHAEMSEAKNIRLERMRGAETWVTIPERREIYYEEEYIDDPTDPNDIDDHE